MPNKTYDSIDDAKKEATSQTNKTGRIHFINFAEGTTDKYVVLPSEKREEKNTDLQIDRISMQEYLKIPNKSQVGRTTQYAVRHGRGRPTVFLWPLPENSTDEIKLELVRYMEDVDKSALQNADVSRRFLPCLTAGLAYYMSMKRPGVDINRIQLVKTEYEERLARAMEEDRERVSIFLKPKVAV
jgi:hypothetical protein